MVGAPVGKEVGRMRVCGTEQTPHTGQRCVRSSAHAQGHNGQPDRIDANHCKHSRSHCAQTCPDKQAI